jgi:hypothetical protein
MIEITQNNPALKEQITLQTPQALGATARVYLHEQARTLPEYDLPVETWQVGQDKQGQEIKINTLGRWLFGVPGYSGHLRIAATGKQVTIHFPSEIEAAKALLLSLQQKIEKGNNYVG